MKERVQEKHILIEHIGVNLMLVDPLTEVLTLKDFSGHILFSIVGFPIGLSIVFATHPIQENILHLRGHQSR